MSDAIRKAMTVVTAPIWLPVAAIGGLVSGPVRGVIDAIAAKTIGSLPGSAVERSVT
ncbi:hypothetical protein ACJMK2_006075 [Sinanodonta woodiana]|uniref:Uncharacterized protein n=1 Tax=Sinanodonta woodiana TaxID=1069815 RepID=A0ABD3VV55_SINWO